MSAGDLSHAFDQLALQTERHLDRSLLVDFHEWKRIADQVGRRKHISWKTKCAAALLELRRVPYDDAKQMTEDQFLSLFHFDHNILHSSEHEDRDQFWNLAPVFIQAHREKTKLDAKVVAKSKRIRREGHHLILSPEARQELRDGNPANVLGEVFREGMYEGRNDSNRAWVQEANRPGGAVRWRKLQSRGFDKSLRKKMDGTVVKR